MPGERSDRHGVVAVVLAGGRADVGVGVDPDDGEVVAVAPGQRRERRHADGAVAPQGEDAGGIVLRDQAQRVVQLGEHGVLRLDAAARGQARGVQGHRHRLGGAARRWKHRFQHRRADHVPAPDDLEIEVGRQFADAAAAGPLPLGPDEPQDHVGVR